MFYSFKDTKEKLDYLESSKIGREQPVNIKWLIETLRETNEMAERYERALKTIASESHDILAKGVCTRALENSQTKK